MDQIIEQITAYADKAHGNQQRKYTPERYIVHPIRVMELCREYTSFLPVLAAALLHDVLEDTPVTEEEVYRFLLSVMNEQEAKQTTRLVVELTDVYIKSDYPHWNRKKRKTKEAERIEQTSAEAQTIKYADIIDNCRAIVQYDDEFGPKFLQECKALLKKMTKGNTELYRRAKETVEDGLQKIQEKKYG